MNSEIEMYISTDTKCGIIQEAKHSTWRVVAQYCLRTTYAELWKVICTRDGILAPRAISMRIAVDLVIRGATTA